MTPQKLKHARLKMRLTQCELGDKLHTSRRMIGHYELGHFPIPKTLEYSVYWLLVSEKLKKIFLKRFFD